MADEGGILGLLGRMNDPNALYGGALSDERTRQAMAGRGLLAMAGSFADSAMPTRMPTPFGAVLGHAASAAGSSEDTIMESRLRNAQAQQAMANVGLLNQMGPAYKLWMDEQLRLAALPPGGGIPTTPPPGTTAGGTTGGLNNPGNIKTLSGDYASYPTPDAGIAAIGDWGVRAQANHGLTTVRGLIDRYAPQSDPGNWMTNAKGERVPKPLVDDAAREMGVGPDDPIDLSDPNMKARWTKAILKQEGATRLAKAVPATGPTGGGTTAEAPLPPPGAAVSGLLNLPENIADRMNAPIPGIGPAPPPAAPTAAAAAPRSAGEALVAMNQATQAAGGLPALSPNLPRVADASGKVVPVPPAPAAPVSPNLVRGGAIPSLLGGGAAPPGPPPQVAAAPPPGQPQSLIPQPPAAAPVPPIAQPQVPPAPAPAPMPTGAPPPLNLPMPPGMPGGMGAPVQATPLQIISQGIAGLSALTGHPAPDFIQKLANQPVEMQMEAYKAYVQAQANQLTEKYKKEIEVASAGTISWLQSQGQLPADLTKMTVQQKLDLDTKMRVLGFLPDEKGNYTKIDPVYLEKKAQEATIEAKAKADYDLKDVTVTDPVTGQQRTQQMTGGQAADWLRSQGGGGAPGTGIPGMGIPPSGPGVPGGTAAPGTAPGVPGKPIYDPRQTEGMGEVGKKNAADFAKVHADADAALQMQTQATNMRQEAQNFYTGPGAEYNQALNKILATLSGDPERANKVASYETFIKDAGFFAREQARLMGARVGVQELTMVRDSLAGPTTTARGIDRVMAQVQGLSDFRLVKQQAMTDYVSQQGRGGWDNSGFETQFNKNVSPYTLMFMRLSDQDRGELLNKLYQSKPGTVQGDRLEAQIKYLTTNNLLPR